MTEQICQGLVILTGLFTFLQFSSRSEWFVRVADFLHIQLTITNIILISVLLVLESWQSWEDWLILIYGVGFLMYQLRIIWPYTQLARKETQNASASPGDTISLFEFNVFMDNANYQSAREQIEKYNPDIVVLIECNEAWREEMRSLENQYPYTFLNPLDNTYGLLIYSRISMRNARFRYLVSEEIPSFSAELELKNGNSRFYVLHPEPPSPTERDTSLPRDKELILLAKEIQGLTDPVIVMGDMNDVAWSHTTRLFQRISGLLDPRKGRGVYNTFHAKIPGMRWPVDHLFHSEHFMLKSMERGDNAGSDHFPMYVELVLDHVNGTEENNVPSPADAEDLEESRKIENKPVE